MPTNDYLINPELRNITTHRFRRIARVVPASDAGWFKHFI